MSYSYPDVIDEQKQTNLLDQLEASAAHKGNGQFAAVVEAIPWAHYEPEQLLRAIHLALELELPHLVIKLAQLGVELFPDHKVVQRYARVFAPAVVQATPAGDLAAFQHWYKENALAFRGQWVAVQDSRLVAAAPSLQELKKRLAVNPSLMKITLTKIA